MTKRIQICEEPYKDIQVGERVMYLSTSHGHTSMNFGFYRGRLRHIPIVEEFYRELKWEWNKERGRYIQSKQWIVRSRRVFLNRGRVYGINQIKERLYTIPTYFDIERLIDLTQ
jgi:hypothetical protein